MEVESRFDSIVLSPVAVDLRLMAACDGEEVAWQVAAVYVVVVVVVRPAVDHVVAAAAVAIAALYLSGVLHQRLHQRPRLSAHHLLLAAGLEISLEAHYWWIAQSSFAWEGFVIVVAKHLGPPLYCPMRRLIQQDSRT